ncbi:epoxide hydrolase 4 isoform X1 [Amia ocellicauda]|uniref:epoxide hydrolase 4 isoform X1 n=1 Tax=Amia ocellicauda TaxID=2972642 RepID=UPI0034639325
MTGLLSTALLVPTRLALRLVSLCYWALVYSTAGLTAALVLTRIAWRGLRDPRGTFHWTARRSPPACTRDPALGEHAYLLTEGSGLRLHYVSKGDPSQPLMLFLHGFPENWFSWRYQLREFGGRWRAVALDLRGCGESAAPGRREDYALDQLLGDIRDIIAGLGYECCVLVGHDWGGVLAWHFAMYYPSMVQRLIVMNAPHPSAWQEGVLRRPARLLRCSHVFFFQIPVLPEIALSLEDYRLVRSLLCSRRVGIRTPGRRLSGPELEAYLFPLSQPGGLTGPLHYFRNLFSNAPPRHQDVGVSCLLIWGEADALLGAEPAQEAGPYVCGSFAVKMIPGCSHWVQQDQPETVNRLMWQFLEGPQT